mmetsp:Transcript_9869/g.19951  ORF Transcript_9869/g.19951 Transcript_9869/m.19951 type:complete len:530 (+) Transcript_9869:90-1679(+)|eukprot:CAMPEP_0119082934 /NCGR_PEP_ID=MMETSP1178-20130426/123631_1 /TAXON_ID=33656 /ORGANISM="unid sp, Strain CCMP2000" /LENGTH=529 /DNA_ID=CAMNT_0007065755 /DNA_START=90 /DNA_END=1679 /DNA_ORIENTATION=-
MASTILEQTRALHEDIEILEKTMYSELGDASATKLKRADEVARDQVVATLLNAHQSKGVELTAIYEDADGARRDEVNAMSGTGVFTAFYDQLKGIREYHRKFPRQPAMESYEHELLGSLLTREDSSLAFSGEEAEGKYVDMHSCHEMFLNLKGADHLDYAAYLQRCTELQSIDKTVAGTAQYQRYVAALCEYFVSFLKRTQPLMPLAELLAKAEHDFAARWDAGEITRWQAASVAAAAATTTEVDIDAASSAEELEALGLDTLKGLLAQRGLKCGGSLKDRAARLYMLKGKTLADIPKKHLDPNAAKPPATDAAAANGDANGDAADPTPATGGGRGGPNRGVALLEEKATRLGELLTEVLEETASMVEKKQSRTYEELERDLALQEENDMEVEQDDDDAADKPIYNPLNLPLGWDGKPIPYWLYKLHGLNIEYKCEICGNYSYWGPRAFERHFQEWRHAHGMRCLGIPNTKEFHGITLIEDAYSLWAKRKAERGVADWNPELDEEFEDRQGNVMNRKTYTDLARQGLLD